MRPLISNSRLLWAAIATMVAGVAFHGAHAILGFGGPTLASFTTNWVYTAVEFLAVGVCAARAWRHPADRWAWTLMASGLLMWSAGDLVWTIWLNNVTNPPFPSVADVLYLAMYPAMYASLMLLMGSRVVRADAVQWLDGGLVALTLAAVGAGFVLPAVTAMSKGHLIEDAVNLAYPLGDLTLLAFVMMAFSLAGWRPGRIWLLLGAGIALDAVGDLIFVYQAAKGTYVAGGILDTSWPAAMVLISLAAWQPVKRRAASAVIAPPAIVMPAIAVVAAVGLLVDASFHHMSPVAVGLAAGGLILGTVRALLTYFDNVRMLRLNASDAITDGLTGLGNRRRLMRDLEDAAGDADERRPRTLVFLDLNSFKRYNDTLGHAAGDALLARFGVALSAAIGDHGGAYRLGGDEFCVLLHGRHREEDPLVAAAVAALTEEGAGRRVTPSCGLATLPDDSATASGLLHVADMRMYTAKSRTARHAPTRTAEVLLAALDEYGAELHDHASGVERLVRELGEEFSLRGEQLDEMLRAAELHDVGKLAIPDEILNKPGPLTDDEWRVMRQHPAIGERILSADPAMAPVARLVRASHERWDGRGYPDGLTGTAIPLGARIIAACDAFDAITSDRCYQAARTTAEALAELRANAGTQFDPEVVEALCRRVLASGGHGQVIPLRRAAPLAAAASAAGAASL